MNLLICRNLLLATLILVYFLTFFFILYNHPPLPKNLATTIATVLIDFKSESDAPLGTTDRFHSTGISMTAPSRLSPQDSSDHTSELPTVTKLTVNLTRAASISLLKNSLKKMIRSPGLMTKVRASTGRGYCSCQSQRQSFIFPCCQRAFIVVHKMGITAALQFTNRHFPPLSKRVEVAELFAILPPPSPPLAASKNHPNHHHYRNFSSNNEDEVMNNASHSQPGQFFESMFRIPTKDDYRHVVITRNWYDAIVSGYLYHKSGKECWLDWYGQPILNNSASESAAWLWNNSKEDWERRLMIYYYQNDNKTTRTSRNNDTTHDRIIQWWHPGNGKDLCRYLATESEEDGLKVYTAWALTSHLYYLVDFVQDRLAREQSMGWNRTMFLCYETFTNPKLHASTVLQLHRWFFPTKQLPDLSSNDGSHDHGQKYQGGHATDHDPILRRRLLEIVRRIDNDMFHNAIKKGNERFGCGSN